MKACLSALIVFLFFTGTMAQDSPLASSQVAISTGLKTQVKPGQKVVVSLTGNESVLVHLLEDSLAIQLSNSGFEVVSREQLELALAKRTSAKQDGSPDVTVGMLDLARTNNADLLVSGSAVLVLSDTQPVQVKAVSIQVVDVSSGKTLIQTLFESKDGIRLTDLSRAFVDVFNQGRK
ncbi:MAG: hypothetical protein HY301_04075 [Verrucomicrobia bacterium]|nr:hypothetical protein [Verrucomicrobiota bacterium]